MDMSHPTQIGPITAGPSPPFSGKAGSDPAASRAAEQPTAGKPRGAVVTWLLHDILFIVMLFLAVGGVVLRLPVTYWIVLVPLFATISIVEGWRHFATSAGRIGMIVRLAAIWTALLLSIYLLFDTGVQGVMNLNATSLAMMTLLALGTFVAGIQARVWEICAVGGILFLAVPGLGWLDQSPLLLSAGLLTCIALGAFAWWIGHRSKPAST